METILYIRQLILKYYKEYEKLINALLKFLLTLWAITGLNAIIGMSDILSNMWIILGIAVAASFFSVNKIVLLALVIMVFNLVYVNWLMGAMALGVLFVAYVGYMRLFPAESCLLLLTMLLIPFNAVYAVPIIGSLYFGISGAAAVAIGYLFYIVMRQFSVILVTNPAMTELSVESIEYIVLNVLDNTIFSDQILATILVLAIVFMSTYIVRIQWINYSRYVAIAVGAVINIAGFFMVNMVIGIDTSLVSIVMMTLVGAVVACGFAIMSVVLDYTKAEFVQFEDEDNYYYVKVIPKVEIPENIASTKNIDKEESQSNTNL